VSDTVWRELVRSATRREFRPNESLLVQGAPGTSLLLLESGRVRVVREGRDGRGRVLVALRGPGDLLGELAGHGDRRRVASVLALEPCVAHSIAYEAFRRLLHRHSVEQHFDAYIVAKMDEFAERSADLAGVRPLYRVADLFLQLVRLADPWHPEPLRIPLSQVAVAEALGLSRRAVAQIVADLRAQGVLADGDPVEVADVRRLHVLAHAL
jgi:CRP-like cAMP-binding protein